MSPQQPAERPQYPTALQQFASRLAELRAKRGLSAQQIQDRTRGPDGKSVVSRAHLYRLEGGISRPSIPVAKALDEVLGARGSLAVFAEPARAEPYLHLPPQPPHFVGRDGLLARLTGIVTGANLTSPPQVVILNGPPGVGKTALALQWANSRHDVFDAVLWADLHGFAPGHPAGEGEILDALLRGLGLSTDRIPGDAAQRRALLLDQLRTRAQRVLLVLDNARDSAQVRGVLPGVPGTTVLVTSRMKLSALVLDADAIQLQVNPLDEADGTQLVIDRVGRERAEAEPDAVSRLVSLCGSFPLALRIAAERVAAHEQKSIRDHVQDLTDRGQRLQLLQLEDEDEDEAIGVRVAFDLSYESLPAEAARLFRLLSLHPGAEFSLAAAAAIAERPAEETELILDALTQVHLLEQLPGRTYRFHDLLQVYAGDVRQQSTTDEHDDAVGRLVDWYLHTVNAAAWALTPGRGHHVRLDPPAARIRPLSFGTPAQAVSWYSRELSNILAIVQLATGCGRPRVAWRISVDLFDYLAHLRPMVAWITTYELALDAGRAVGDPLLIAEAAEKLAEGHRRSGNTERAAELAAYAIATAEPHGPSLSLGFALLGAGNDARVRGDTAAALDLIEQSVDVFVAIGLRIGEATARSCLGIAHYDAGDLEDATAEGARALEMFRTDEDLHGSANAGLALARIHRQRGLHSTAQQLCDDAIRGYQSTGDSWGEADALGELAAVLSDLGDRAAALRSLKRAWHLVRSNDPVKAAELKSAIGDLTGDQPPL
ncbi:NB-ARC domain-containing protein [Amycolatopsis tolypomycina]|uniref:NB-ARC domain-containing protein n=1 Tax=Amycolatopsis tolypomycina TaxID=208445 RepID=UPI0033BA2D63